MAPAICKENLVTISNARVLILIRGHLQTPEAPSSKKTRNWREILQKEAVKKLRGTDILYLLNLTW
jgi:hypothetical protein